MFEEALLERASICAFMVRSVLRGTRLQDLTHPVVAHARNTRVASPSHGQATWSKHLKQVMMLQQEGGTVFCVESERLLGHALENPGCPGAYFGCKLVTV